MTRVDKTIKLWKIKERQVEAVVENNQNRPYGSRLQLPRTVAKEATVTAVPKRTFAHAHAYHIHSISACSDAETFLSADDLRVNLWHLDDPGETSFNLVDLKPGSIEELTEVITSCTYHPQHCALFAYSTSKGAVRVCDMRSAALCDRAVADYKAVACEQTFFTEIIGSVSDCRFSPDGRLIAARDYLNIHLYDVRGTADSPLHTLPVHDHIRPRLCDLYENDCIFDKFRLAFTPDATQVITGSYGDRVRALDVEPVGWAEDIQADRSVFRLAGSSLASLAGFGTAVSPAAAKARLGRRLVGRRVRSMGGGSMGELDAAIDYSRRTLNVAVHPSEAVMAVAATSNLFIFTSSA